LLRPVLLRPMIFLVILLLPSSSSPPSTSVTALHRRNRRCLPSPSPTKPEPPLLRISLDLFSSLLRLPSDLSLVAASPHPAAAKPPTSPLASSSFATA
ncbi:hypothetical protein U1Q18_025738, partial [Sarracenia purpurea var. burkii]